ncbi:Gamma-glutamyl phosphate reductase [Thalictrum thalictroides]|uniref:Gamma-glutamyl phosphate reductase n=1 Tax=Thalictrum thalictroides TaxID=46969 RepID=A0A7J6V900_THATH|nr:Gamma-glutamyl phosphate reductase [Thalictrum thalictroides]
MQPLATASLEQQTQFKENEMEWGKEARRSNAILHKVITAAIPDTVGERLIGLVTARDEIPDLLKLDDVIDLVIPRGSNSLVSQIKESTKIPVLGHADGVCHVYVDKYANLEMAKQIVLGAKIDYPAACNALETLLVHNDLLETAPLTELISDLRTEGVTIYGGLRITIDHIHRHGSAHTDCILAEDHDVSEIFLNQVDSAAIIHNASTRFCDGARFGLGAEVGISTSRIHARGSVGVEGLLTTQCVKLEVFDGIMLLRGSGQVVDGDKGVTYTHNNLPIES